MKKDFRQYLKVSINIIIALIILLIFIFVVPKILVFFMPFLIGWVIACIASPPVRFFERKVKIKRKTGSAVVIILVLAIVVLVLYGVGYVLVHQMIGFLQDLPENLTSMQNKMQDSGGTWDNIYNRLPANIQSFLDDFSENMGGYAANILKKFSEPTVDAIGTIAKSIPGIIIGIIMAILSSYFFVADRGYLNRICKKMLPLSIQQRWTIAAASMKKAVGGYFIAQFKIEFWIYLLLLVGLFILKVDYVPLVALGIAFLDLLPFFGTGTVMVPWAIFEIIDSDYVMAIGLLIVWGVGQIVRQLIQPKIMGDTVGLAPLPTLFLLFIGYKLGSVIGMIVVLPIGLIILSLNEEGMFDTTKDSIRLFVKKINDFRKLDKEDYAYIKSDETEELKKEQEETREDE